MPKLIQQKKARLDRAGEKALLTGLALAAQLFWGPEPELCRDMAQGEFGSDLKALAPYLDEPGRSAAGNMAAWAKGRSGEELRQALEDEYFRLFVNAKEGLKAPLYHSHYETKDGALMGRPLAMMAERLEAAGIDLGEETGEPADHLAVEAEYLYFLLEAGLTRDREELLTEASLFAAREMLPWVREMARRLAQTEEEGSFYRASAAFLVSLLKALSRWDNS